MHRLFLGGLVATFIYNSSAQADPMSDLGTTVPNVIGSSTALAISPDGNIIVGRDSGRAFRWTSAGIESLGTLNSNGSGSSTAQLISADGNVIAGYSSQTGISGDRLFRWTKVDGMQNLGSLSRNDNTSGSVRGISSDGSVIVGSSFLDSFTQHAFRWTETLGKMQDLGTLRSGNLGHSSASGVSADGKAVAGNSDTENPAESHAFIWTEISGQMQDLGTLNQDNSGSSFASKISADGSTVIGNSSIGSNYESHAFRWTETLGRMQDLGTLHADNSGYSYATGVDRSGSNIIGYADSALGRRAFRWTEASGQMQDLGSLRTDRLGDSRATAISADGQTVVGEASTDNRENHAFFWTSKLGKMQDLGTLRADNTGSSTAAAVSADGRVIVGEASSDEGPTRAFIYRVSDSLNPDPGIQDYENILKSFPKLAAEKEMAAAQQQLAASRLLDTNCFVGTTGANCLRLTGVVSNAQSDGDIGRRSQSQGLLTLGHGFTDNFTLGANVSAGNTRLHNSGVDPKAAYGLSIWGRYSDSGLTGIGLQANAGIGYNTQDNNLNRGKDLNKVQQIKGTTDLNTVSGRFSLGYGFSHESGWLLTPGVALVRQQTAFDGYKEKDGAFTASYKRAHLKSTVVDLGLTAKKAITSVSGLELGAGLEQDLSVERMRLKGSSELPGAISFDNKSSLDRNSARPYATVGYTYDLNSAGTLSAGVRAARDTFSDQPEVSISASYGIKF